MVRKPIKKRAAPRKSVKFDRVIRKAFTKKAVPVNPKLKLKIGSPEDPFFVHPETIPDGIALQWVSSDADAQPSLRRATESGWKLVHGLEAIRNLVLVWAPQALADAQRDENIKKAQDQIRQNRELFGLKRKGGSWPAIVSNSFISSSDYQRVPSDSPPIDVAVTTKFRLSAQFQDAAAALGIDPQVYAERRLALYLRGDIGGILLPIRGALELFEDGNFTIKTSGDFNGRF
jgi:hypothetical protein